MSTDATPREVGSNDELGAERDERLRLETMLAHRGMLDTAHRLCDIKVAAERERFRAALVLRHDYEGSCPDEEQPEARDPACKACATLLSLGA